MYDWLHPLPCLAIYLRSFTLSLSIGQDHRYINSNSSRARQRSLQFYHHSSLEWKCCAIFFNNSRTNFLKCGKRRPLWRSF